MRDIATLAASTPGAEPKEGALAVPASGLLAALEALKKQGGFLLLDISAVDRPATKGEDGSVTTAGFFEVSYRLLDFKQDSKEMLTVRVLLDHETPTLPTAMGIWKAADVLEREVWDLMGIEFTGRGKMERILTRDDFEGHPLRKDFVPPKRDRFPEVSWGKKAAEGGQ
jgi:NADH-quinone oxidoreductase subunit C